MLIQPIRTRLFHAGESLEGFLEEHLPGLREDTIIVITSKIIALSQGRLFDAASKRSLIKKEAERVLSTDWCFLTKYQGEWCANAGVDESNATDRKVISLPKRPDLVARRLLVSLRRTMKKKRLGIIITDTRLVPLRQGTLGIALAWAGFNPLKSYIGQPDLFGRPLKMTVANLADALAAGAVAMMGEGNERCPLAFIQDSPVVFSVSAGIHGRLAVEPKDDLYAPAYRLR